MEALCQPSEFMPRGGSAAEIDAQMRVAIAFAAGTMSRLKTSDRYDMNSVFARVGKFAARDHHHQSRLIYANAVVFRVRLAHKIANLEKMACALFDLTVPQLEFNQGKASIWEMQNTVGLKSVSVAVIR